VDPYPTKPVKVVVAFAAGSSSDVVARRVAQGLAAKLRQPFVVENRPGASGGIGAKFVASAKPDGYTLLSCNQATHGSNPALHPSLDYDAVNDFAPIVRIARSPLVVSVNPEVPAQSLADLVRLAKAQPTTVRYASAGNGSLTHILGELLARQADIKLVHVPYKGDALALNDVLGNHVEVLFSTPLLVAPQVKANRLRALAVTGLRRASTLPSVPTFAESGVIGADLMSWSGLCAPARTEASVIYTLSEATLATIMAPEVKDQLESQGYEVSANTPEEFSTFIRNEIARLRKVVNDLGIRADD